MYKNEPLQKEVACLIARHNCVLMLDTRAELDPKFVAAVCRNITTMCAKYGEAACTLQSENCLKASQALENGDEETFLSLCRQSCLSCPFPARMQARQYGGH